MRTHRQVLTCVLVASFVLAPTMLWAGGSLVPTDPNVPALGMKLHEVKVEIKDQLATTKVTQVFLNNAERQIEAMYTFPVPEGASISDFSMWINGIEMKGQVMEKQEAARIYDSIVRKAKDPGLLEHVGHNIFRIRVFPIAAKGEQKISLTYSERLDYNAGTCTYRYPLMVKNVDNKDIEKFSIEAKIVSTIPLKEVTSSTHKATLAKKDDHQTTVTVDKNSGNLNADFELRYQLQKEKTDFDLVCYREKGEDGYFMLLVTPKVNITDDDILPKDVTFVFDTSGSMAGEKLEQAKAALKFCVNSLRPKDRFNIVTFASDVDSFRREPLEATKENKESALKFVDRLVASGGTNINGALAKALEFKSEKGRLHIAVFLTDGEPTEGVTDPATIVKNVMAKNSAGTRIFTFGVGTDLNRTLLDRVVAQTRAVAEYVEPKENIEKKVSSLFKKLSLPVMSQISIDMGDAGVQAMYPKEIPDLFAHTQMVVVGRYRKSGTYKVRMTGTMLGKETTLEKTITFPEAADGGESVGQLWAMRKIAYLMDQIQVNGENREIVDEVITLGKKHRVATPYTSFLVLEPDEAKRMDMDRRLRQGKLTPDRWDSSQGKARPLDSMSPSTDDPVEYEAKEADHNESGDNENFKMLRGQGAGMAADKPFKGTGTHDLIGGGSGGGGRYGGRLGGKEELIKRGGAGGTLSTVLEGLKWLSRHQGPDGSWGVKHFTAQCGGKTTNDRSKYSGSCAHGAGEGGSDTYVTGLSVLSFLGAGYFHSSRDTYDGINFGNVVREALKWIMDHQDAEGCIGDRKADAYLNDHLICALALSEAYGLTESTIFKDAAQKAVDFVVASQNKDGGWGPKPRDGASNALTTAMAVKVLKSAELSGLSFPKEAYTNARAWFDSVTRDDGAVGYRSRDDIGKKLVVRGLNEKFDDHPITTAAGVTSRIFIDKKKDAAMEKAAKTLSEDLPKWGDTSSDFLHWYEASIALFQFDGPDGPTWRKWNEPLKDALLRNQNTTEDDKKGSWEPTDRWGGLHGRVYATAINVLTLEVYYRYPGTWVKTK